MKTAVAIALLALALPAAADFTYRVPTPVVFSASSGGGSEEPSGPPVPTEEDRTAWEEFALDRGLSHSASWDGVDFGGAGLTSLPSEVYPNNQPSGHLHFHDNQLTHVDPLRSLTSIGGQLSLIRNHLTQIDGLSSLSSVGLNIVLHDNNLSSVDGLRALTSLGGNIHLYRNPELTDLSGLSGIVSMGGYVYVEKGVHERPGFKGIPSNAWLCQPEQADKFVGVLSSDYAVQVEVCEG